MKSSRQFCFPPLLASRPCLVTASSQYPRGFASAQLPEFWFDPDSTRPRAVIFFILTTRPTVLPCPPFGWASHFGRLLLWLVATGWAPLRLNVHAAFLQRSLMSYGLVSMLFSPTSRPDRLQPCPPFW
jgi:hypothetical protein